MNTEHEGHDVLIVDILTAPNPTGFGLSQLSTDRRWDGHPLVSRVIGFAAARLTVEQDTSYVTWYGFDVGDEVSALSHAHDIIGRGTSPIVTFGPHGYVMRMVEARMREHGLDAPTCWADVRRAGIDLADEVTLGGVFPRVSLADTVVMYELLTHDPKGRHVGSTEGLGALTPEALTERLRVRMDAVITLFTQLRLGPRGGIIGSLVARETALPQREERLAS